MFAFSSLYHEQKNPKNGHFPSLCIPAGITLDHHSFTLTLLIDPRVLSADCWYKVDMKGEIHCNSCQICYLLCCKPAVMFQGLILLLQERKHIVISLCAFHFADISNCVFFKAPPPLPLPLCTRIVILHFFFWKGSIWN